MYGPDDVLDGWTLQERIGRGGMGEVWRATRDGERAAIKILFARPDRHEALAKRFEREVAAAARIDHPGIVRVLGYGTDEAEGSRYLVMELLEGASLRDWMAGRNADEVVAAVRAVLEPLAAAHRCLDDGHPAPIVHRDLKPENVFVLDDGSIKLLDFGISRQSGRGTDVTDTGVGMGTAAYMSPEQATDARDVGPAADVWSIGVMLYEAVAGRPPFAAPSRNEIITKILTRAPIPLRDAVAGVPNELAKLVERCLEKEASRRPPDAAALAELLDDVLPGARSALERIRSEPGSPASASRIDTSPRRGPRWRWIAVGLAGAGAVLVTLLARPPAARAPTVDAPAAADAGAADEPSLSDYVELPAAPGAPLGVTDDSLEEVQSGFRPSADVRGPERGFSIQRREVTWGELETWLGSQGRQSPLSMRPGWLPAAAADRAPYAATGVPWEMARAYCRDRGGDLPTEEQWERAARGAEGRRYAWGGDAADPQRTHLEGTPGLVGAHDQDRTPEGVEDLTGNAREWTRGLFRSSVDGSVGEWVTSDGRTFRAIRGLPLSEPSRWRPPDEAPIAHRVPLCATGECPEGTDDVLLEVGFRCVLEPPAD